MCFTGASKFNFIWFVKIILKTFRYSPFKWPIALKERLSNKIWSREVTLQSALCVLWCKIFIILFRFWMTFCSWIFLQICQPAVDLIKPFGVLGNWYFKSSQSICFNEWRKSFVKVNGSLYLLQCAKTDIFEGVPFAGVRQPHPVLFLS